VTTLSAEAYQAWVAEGCKGDLDAWAGIWAARQEDQARKRKPRREKVPFPKHWALQERGEGGLQEQADRLLWALIRRGALLSYYHRPDRRNMAGEMAGVPDCLVAVRDGLVLGIELKRAEGTVTDWQTLWLRAFGDHGACCRSIEDVEAFLRRFGVEV